MRAGDHYSKCEGNNGGVGSVVWSSGSSLWEQPSGRRSPIFMCLVHGVVFRFKAKYSWFVAEKRAALVQGCRAITTELQRKYQRDGCSIVTQLTYLVGSLKLVYGGKFSWLAVTRLV